MFNARRVSMLAAAVMLTALGTAQADVYVTSPTTGRVVVLDSAGNQVRIIGEAGGLTQPFGLSLDSQRRLVVADFAAGRIVRFDANGTNGSIVASNIPNPDGLIVGPNDDLFLVSRDDRQAAPRVKARTGDTTSVYLRGVFMVPANSALPVQIASIDESTRLAQTALLSSGPNQGDLIVLSSRPGFVARLHQTGPTEFVRTDNLILSIPGEPTGMALSRTGQLLIATADGKVLRYSDQGVRMLPDFATGLPAGSTRISVSFDGVVHAIPMGSTSVIRYDAYGMRLPDLSGSTLPLAGAVTTACVPTPRGHGVTVSPAAGVNVIFDNVVTAGDTCLSTTALGANVFVSPRGNTIPSYARKLFEDAGFVVYDLTTTAVFTDSVAPEFFSPNPDTKLIWAHGTGNVFSDVTVLTTPTDPRGRVGGLSEFIVYLDTRPNAQVVQFKLQTLLDGLSSNMFAGVDPGVLAQLEALANQIAGNVGSGGRDGNRVEAILELKQFKQLVKGNSGAGIPNGVDAPAGSLNAAGTYVSWADTLIFQLGL